MIDPFSLVLNIHRHAQKIKPMSKTISTTGNPPDIDGRIATRAESLSQRIRSAYRYRLREWFLNPNGGLDYDLIFTHQISDSQTQQVLVNVIREEGGAEITNIRDIVGEFRPDGRTFHFSCNVDTIYGDVIDIDEDFV